MLNWPHSGFHAQDGVWVAADDTKFAVRLARYCARNPVALSRIEYHEQDSSVTYRSDKPTGLLERYDAPVSRSHEQVLGMLSEAEQEKLVLLLDKIRAHVPDSRGS